MVIRLKFSNLSHLGSIGIIIILLLNNPFLAEAQATSNNISDTLELNSSIRYGRLPNGLSYFIKNIPESQSKLHMRLIPKVGAYHEAGHEFDFAHAIEHLAFKATKDFPIGIDNSERVEIMGSNNYNITAYSGRKHTEYLFDISTETLQEIETGMLWFRNVIGDLQLTQKDIESVRSEVREEFLSNNGDKIYDKFATSKMYRKIIPCENEEIDFLTHYENFPPKMVREFYKKWYQPRFFAVIVVGNIENPELLEDLIKSTFSSLENAQKRQEPKDCDSLYFNRPTQFVIVERQRDPAKFIEDRTAKIHLFIRNPGLKKTLASDKGLYNMIRFELLIEILAGRFKVATSDYGYNGINIYNLYKLDMPPAMEIVHEIEGRNGQNSLEMIGKVLNQLKTSGIINPEFERIKKNYLTNLKKSEVSQASYWVKHISDYYVKGEALPTDKQEYLVKYLQNITLEDLNEYTRELISDGPQDIGIVVPEGHEALFYKDEEVRSWLAEGSNADVEPFELPRVPELMSKEEVETLSEVGYVDEGTAESGSREFLLDNGVKLVIKNDKSDEGDKSRIVNLHGFSLGGAADFPEEDFSSAINASSIIQHSGVNELDKFQVNRVLSANGMLPGAVSAYIDNTEHGIYGSAPEESFELMMQLIHLYFTDPNKNKVAFEDWKAKNLKHYLNSSSVPYITDFNNMRRSITGDKSLPNSFNRKVLPGGSEGFESVRKTDFNKAFDIYQKHFGDAKGFTFLITGSLEVEEVLCLAKKYLGNLPTSQKYTNPLVPRGTQNLIKGPSFQMFPNQANYSMQNVSYGTFYICEPKDHQDWQEQLKMEVLGEVVRQKLRNLRFKEGYGLYDMNARGEYNAELRRYEVRTYLYCQPKDFCELQKKVKDIYSETIEGAISETELNQALELVYYFNFSDSAKFLGVLIQRLYKHHRFGQPWIDPEVAEEYTRHLTRDDIVEVAGKYLKEENFHELVIRNN